MREDPFRRDTVVLLVIAFGFGALFAWGLITPPSGKPGPPATTPTDWPAWVQAILSAAAILAAGRFAVAQHRMQLRDRAGVLVALVAQICDEAVGWEDKVSSRPRQAEVITWDFGHLSLLVTGLGAIPLHELPRMEMVAPVTSIQRDCGALLKRLEDIRRKAAFYPIVSVDVEDCAALRRDIVDARHLMLDINARHFSPAWYDRLTGT